MQTAMQLAGSLSSAAGVLGLGQQGGVGGGAGAIRGRTMGPAIHANRRKIA